MSNVKDLSLIGLRLPKLKPMENKGMYRKWANLTISGYMSFAYSILIFYSFLVF